MRESEAKAIEPQARDYLDDPLELLPPAGRALPVSWLGRYSPLSDGNVKRAAEGQREEKLPSSVSSSGACGFPSPFRARACDRRGAALAFCLCSFDRETACTASAPRCFGAGLEMAIATFP
ncbi:hypothetical protein AAFF_G00356950 [Aldrovandia affinis]|uniref:Uncharacterized protein n=1 Tax=Aldrovandia affinis TaxID=143900 RepID=A0AAD7T9G6_9TELE|nr:hypothetical protein AAFF_G00356950 [Aldrovandia affinis]